MEPRRDPSQRGGSERPRTAANVAIIGAAAGVIIATIITIHMPLNAPTSVQLSACEPGIVAADVPCIVGIPLMEGSCVGIVAGRYSR